MDFQNKAFQTSLTDNIDYPEFCLKASLDYSIFRDFRRNEIYRIALEHDSFEQGLEYLEATKKSSSNVLSKINEFLKNDQIGNPEVFDYDGIGTIAPPTLRYIKILSDLESEFGTLDNVNICEIGVGYGGMCRIINSYFKVKTYTLVDLKPVLMLAQRYLDHYPLNTTLIYKTMNELSKENYDLVISNYAFTEIRREVQDIYLEKVLLSATKGYITYNEINPEDFHSYTKEELIQLIPQIRVNPEVGILHPKDCTLVW
ncbi:putative sugar O-methyltransferase [Nostoc sp. CENA67]|uniref:Putative sugar O-methyltransferase n=1 Tax=Amazonocrinis nigriterrae CENA67 TaxID=2794033 RepID=A0A8J7HQF5_9NOST|nr:putative sugar O-methyltransferase [Amazonocrinis nigriterrae]MBH8561605.1 putative sugar O-methyltransferase [Amazonocrinis nigriterrae CENA67]